MAKIFLTADQLLIDSYQLAATIYQQGFKPTFIIGVWRGGAPVGIAVQEFFEFKGIPTDHIAIRSSSYYGIESQHQAIKLYGMDYVIENVSTDDQLLIVDDVFDTGRSINAIQQFLIEHCGERLPKAIKYACPWYKPNKNLTELIPDFYLHTTDDWLVFPHEVTGLTLEEIKQGKPEIADILMGSAD